MATEHVVIDMLDRVQNFQKEVCKRGAPPMPCALVDSEVQEYYECILEEANELVEAQTTAEQADALLDSIYFQLGALIRMGIVPAVLFNAVHEANMRKVAAKTDRSESDATKPEGWMPPVVEKVFDITPKFIESLPEAMVKANKLMMMKARDYNSETVSQDDYFPFGLQSYMQMINMKTNRLMSLTVNKGTPNFESMRDSLLDLINYACMMYEHLEQEDFIDD